MDGRNAEIEPIEEARVVVDRSIAPNVELRTMKNLQVGKPSASFDAEGMGDSERFVRSVYFSLTS